MKKIVLLILMILIGLIAFKIFTITPQGWKGDLIDSMGQKIPIQTANPSPVPSPNAPKTFQFDSSTDLQAELEKVNPKVLDSDFE